MRLEFQHVASSTMREQYTTTLTLYGRMINGKSIAVHVPKIPHYGYFQCDNWVCMKPGINKYIKLWCSIQHAMKFGLDHFDHNTSERVPCRDKKAAIERKCNMVKFEFHETSGFNIRDVREGREKCFIRFQTYSLQTFKHICHVLTKPTREEMTQWLSEENINLEIPAQFQPFMLYETHIDPDAQYMIDHQLISCGWMSATGQACHVPKTTCSVEMTSTRVENIEPPQDLAPIRVLSYDIEAQPHVYDDGREPGFPEPEVDPILTIGVTWFDLLDTRPRQAVFQLEPKGVPPLTSLATLREEQKTDEFDPSTTQVYSFSCEKNMLHSFALYVRESDPDIITGYNILGFDNPYLIKRAATLGFESSKFRDTLYVEYNLGRSLKNTRTSLRKVFRSSNQTGGSESYQTSLTGRTWTDLFKVVMTDHKLRSYKMDDVAAEFLGTRKIHIAYADIPEMQKTKEGRHTLATYCVKDSWIPCQLGIKRSKFINAISMANVTGVSLDYVLHRGQQIRTITLMLAKVRERERKRMQRWFLPDERTIKQPQQSFEGAVVITPMPGFYKEPVVTLDFASLYPSIMRAFNMCFSTLIATPAEARERGFHFSDDDPDPTFRPVRDFETTDITPETKENPFHYVEKPTDVCFVTNKVRVGILPEILSELLSKRKQTKKKMKQTPEESVKYSVLDGYQLALKVCANSVYGFTGASTGFLPEKRIASNVTKAGRGMTNEAKNKVEFHYRDHGVKIVYGDSVIGNTPLLLRINGEIVVRRIESLADVWGNYHGGKESCELSRVETWTETGWTRVQRVIRHRLEKDLVRVQTHTGHVICTEDHSLVRENGEEVAPRDVKEGDTLMHNVLRDFPARQYAFEVGFTRMLHHPSGATFSNLKEASQALGIHTGVVTNICTWVPVVRSIQVTPVLCRFMGMFIGDGSCGSYKCVSGKKKSWAINNQNLEMLNTYMNIGNKCFPEFEWRIMNTRKSSGVYKLTPKCPQWGAISAFVAWWRKLCYNERSEKIIPDCVMNSSMACRRAFLQGLMDADGTKNISEYEISQKGAQISLSITMLLYSVGHNHVVVDTRPDKPNIFRMRTRSKTRKNPNRVRFITPYTTQEEYVYDLTTDNHHFQAGVGSLVVHNTDSIFIHLPPSLCPLGTPEEVEMRATALGHEMSELCNTCFLPPNDLEYEKFYWPILLKGKKRYAGWKVEPGKKAKLDAKGFECVRRDFAPIVSKTQKRVFDLLIKERDTPGAVAYARSRVEDLLNGRCEIEELTLSKQLTQLPENYKSNAAHVELAKRLIRDLPPTVAPKVGDRIDFLIRTGEEKQYQRAVTPDEIRSGEYTVDTRYYLDKQLRKPLFRVFDMVVDNPDDIFRVEGFKREIPKSSPFAKYVTDRPRREKRPRTESKRSTRKKQKVQSIHAFFK